MKLCIKLYIKLCGLIDTIELSSCVEVFFSYSLELSNPLNPLGVRHPTDQCGNAHFFPFYIFLDADITSEDPQVGQGGLQDAPRVA